MRTKFPKGSKQQKIVNARHSFLANLRKTICRTMLRISSYGGMRDYYGTLGYPTELTSYDLFAKYSRDDLAFRIVTAFPNATWSSPPRVIEVERDVSLGLDDSDFEKASNDLAQRLNLWNHMRRADILAGLGRYSALFMGFGGAADSNLVS